MKRHSKLAEHLGVIHSIRSIIAAMKNLSLVEIRKISKFISEQQKVADSMEKIATDFFAFNQRYLSGVRHDEVAVAVLLGSERGFCGDFNEAILDAWHSYAATRSLTQIPVIVVGAKLATKAQESLGEFRSLAGASTAEEILGIILSLMQSLKDVYPASWIIICNEETNNSSQIRVFRPFDRVLPVTDIKFTSSPLLNLSPDEFFTGLLDEYLFVELYQVFYDSFLLENRQRSQHMDAALQWLDRTDEKLMRDLNVARQEEITQDIEEIMLSVEMVLKSDKNYY